MKKRTRLLTIFLSIVLFISFTACTQIDNLKKSVDSIINQEEIPEREGVSVLDNSAEDNYDETAKSDEDLNAEEETQKKAEEEAKARAEAKTKAEEEARKKAEEEAKAKAEAEAKAKAEEEARKKAEEEAKAKAEAEAKAKAEEEARKKAEEEANAKNSEPSTFWVKFIDVGQGDAALVQCDGHYMLIDGGDKSYSDTIYSILKQNNVSALDLVVATHPHADHVGGLPGALNYANANLILCPSTSYDSEAFRDFKKYADKSGGITVPKPGDNYTLGSASIKILGVNSLTDENNSSIVLKIVYGQTSFLFTGDANREAEGVILSKYESELDADVLKVGHHGGENATSYPFLRAIMPEIAIISVGQNNSYGHPTDNTLSRLRDADATVYRTDLQGDILCTSDGSKVTVSVEKNADTDTFVVNNTAPSSQITKDQSSDTETVSFKYVLNNNTKKFHKPGCSSVKTIKPENYEETNESREEIIARGFDPCKKCNP